MWHAIRRRNGSLARSASPGRHLGIEQLEDRRLLATVTSNADIVANDGVTTLREAIMDAVPGETIDFQLNLNNLTIGLELGELTIDKSLKIDASMLNSLTIDGGNTSRIFNITSNGSLPSVELVGLTLRNGDPGGNEDGGAIFSEGLLVLRESFIVNNQANAGGGVFVQVPGTGNGENLRIEDSLIEGNIATQGGGVAVRAGGFGTPTSDFITIVNSTIRDNTADVLGAVSDGGRIFAVLFGATLTIDGVTLENNQAGDSGGGAYVDLQNGATLNVVDAVFDQNDAGGGGGLFVEVRSNSSLSLMGSQLTGNVAAATGGGGAAFSLDSYTSAEVVDSYFSGNVAVGGQAIGGGLLADIDRNSTLTVRDSDVSQNTAFNGGGDGASCAV